MAALLWCALLIIVLLLIGWWLSWLASRLDRAQARAERTWAVLDASLVRRAQRAAEVARSPGTDPATCLLVCGASAAAMQRDLSHAEREQAESALSHILKSVGLPGIELEQDRASLARRLHNDAVSTARSLRSHQVVRIFRLGGFASEPQSFEMAEDQQLVWPRGKER